VAKTVSIDNLGAEIALAVQQYTEDVSEAILREVDATSKAVLDDIQARSPVRTGEYKKGWKRKKDGKGDRIKYTIYQAKKPRIAHLLEFGHAKIGGGRVRAREHIRPAYEKHVPAMEKRIKRIVENGGGP